MNCKHQIFDRNFSKFIVPLPVGWFGQLISKYFQNILTAAVVAAAVGVEDEQGFNWQQTAAAMMKKK